MKQNDLEQISCERVRSRLDSYIGDELLIQTTHEMQKHLHGCRTCLAEMEALVRLKNMLRSAVRAEEVPPALRAKIQTGIRASRPAGRFSPVSMFSLTRGHIAIAASLLAALCLGVWVVFAVMDGVRDTNATLQARLNPTLSEQTRQNLNVGLGDHVHCAIDNGFWVEHFDIINRDLGNEYAALVTLVEGNLGRDYTISAAHTCLVNEREFAYLIFRNRDKTLSVILTKKDGEDFTPDDWMEVSGAPLHRGRTEDYAVAGFETGEHLAFVVSNLNPDENTRIAERIAPSVRRLLISPQTVRDFKTNNPNGYELI